MDNEELKKKFPFLKNVDLDDPKQKKQFGMILAIIAMGLLVIVLAIMSSAKKKEAAAPPVSIDATEQTAPSSGRKQKTELLELPQADNTREDEVLSSTSMISVRERQRNNRGSSLKDLYGQAEYTDDPMATPEEKESGAYGTGSTSSMDDIKKMYNINNTGSVDDSGEPEDRPQTPSPKKKTINRGGTPSASTSHGMVSPDTPTVSSDPPSRVSYPAAREDYEGYPSAPADTTATAAAPKTVRKSGGISSLDDWGSVDGIGGLDGEDQYVTVDADKPVKVMFVREQKITSGQRVFLRLLDDIAADGILIPKNTHLSAQCTIGERLQIKVNNIEINGKIINLGYTAFDNDGNEGLHCPETANKQQIQQGQNTAMNIGQSILQSRVTGIAGQVLSSGTSIIRSSTGKVTAQVNAGYTFFLLKDEF